MLDVGLQSLLELHLQHIYTTHHTFTPHVYTTSRSFAVLQVAYLAQPGPAARWSQCSYHHSCICCDLSPLKSRISAYCWMATRLLHEIVTNSHNGKDAVWMKSCSAESDADLYDSGLRLSAA